mgnify:CR=1 FL=1|tara:strand:+ start:13079 stop:14410 length:1332 start_codon:yes stop_codon:yes gene_type:complete
MKILTVFHDLNDLGGIINNQEHLHLGFLELGHDSDVCKLVWKDEVRNRTTSGKTGLVMGSQGMRLDQRGGWVWPTKRIIPYKGKRNMDKWKAFASTFDLIIWQIPVPSKNKNNLGNHEWPELYNVPVKQIAYIHDGHFPKRYPWLYAIRHHLCGVAATHPCGYHSLIHMDLPRALAFTAQADQGYRDAGESWKDRLPGWFSLQTFKGWKRVDELVRAVPYMKNCDPMRLAGGGIQWYYMTSKDKCKDDYLCSIKKDPDLEPGLVGERIWNRAIGNGLDYMGYIQNDMREAALSEVRFLIDPSWSHNFARYGDHPNRTSIDAVINGVVPIARNHGIAGADDGIGEFFKNQVNYVMVPWDATPKQFAEIVDDTMDMPKAVWEDMLEEGRKVARLWGQIPVAQTFIDLYNGVPAGVYKKVEDVGTFNEEVFNKGGEVFDTFFCGEK